MEPEPMNPYEPPQNLPTSQPSTRSVPFRSIQQPNEYEAVMDSKRKSNPFLILLGVFLFFASLIACIVTAEAFALTGGLVLFYVLIYGTGFVVIIVQKVKARRFMRRELANTPTFTGGISNKGLTVNEDGETFQFLWGEFDLVRTGAVIRATADGSEWVFTVHCMNFDQMQDLDTFVLRFEEGK